MERYLAAVKDIWATRTMETAQRLVEGLFPVYVIDPETVTHVRRFVGTEKPNQG